MLIMVFDATSDTNIQIELGQRLQRLRLKMDLSQAQLAKHAGVSRRTVTNMENGQGCSLLTLIALLRGLGLSARWDLLFPEETNKLSFLSAPTTGTIRQRASGKHRKSTTLTDHWQWE
jgi:transcriptional regulator with XRE-family HTH domain